MRQLDEMELDEISGGTSFFGKIGEAMGRWLGNNFSGGEALSGAALDQAAADAQALSPLW